jgi:Tfp pilus assembly PilM family ATPase
VRRSIWLRNVPPTVAIEIATRRITVAEIHGSGAQASVSACASETLPADAVQPSLTGVNIANPGLVADALRSAISKAGLRTPSRAALVVPDGTARVSLLPFEQLPGRAADLEQLIRWQLKKSMPFPLDEAQVSQFIASTNGTASTIAAVVSRRDVIAQYEAVTSAVGIHAGIVDLASFNVMNAVMASNAAADGDALLVCLAAEGTTLAILRGDQLMFYRHRTAVDEEPLSALVHQTTMYHEDRLGGAQFGRIWICGASFTHGTADLRIEMGEQLRMEAQAVDVRAAAALKGRVDATPELLDALAAPVGVLIRERRAA